MGVKFCLPEEDRHLIEDVLGTEAAEYLFVSASQKMLYEFTGSREDLEVQDGLSKIVQWFGLNYAIYWTVSTSNSGKSALIWGDGHCIAPNQSNIIAENDAKLHEFLEGVRRKQALTKICAWFGGSENDDVASKSDLVSDVEMFYLTSIYYAFPFEKPSSPCQAFHTGRTIWESDTRSYSEYYQSRACLAKAAQFKTVAFIPLKSGVVEIGSGNSIPKDQKLIQVAKDVLGSKFVPAKTLLKVFGQELCLGGAKSCEDSEDHNLIQMAKAICGSNFMHNEMFPDDIGRELSLGIPKISRSVSTHLSRNVKEDSGFPDDTDENEAELFQLKNRAIINFPADGSVANLDKNALHSFQASSPADQNPRDGCIRSANSFSKKRRRRVKRSIRIPALSNKLAVVPPDEYSWRKYGRSQSKVPLTPGDTSNAPA